VNVSAAFRVKSARDNVKRMLVPVPQKGKVVACNWAVPTAD